MTCDLWHPLQRDPGGGTLRGAAGYTVIELLIALLIASVAMMIASQLLYETQRRATHAALRSLDPAVTIAWKQIRADVQASAKRFGSEQILILHGHPAGNVRYRRVGDELLRVAGPTFDAKDERVILTRVKEFRWEKRGTGKSGRPLIEIYLSWEQTRLLGPLVAEGERQIAPKVVASQSLVLALRGGGGENW